MDLVLPVGVGHRDVLHEGSGAREGRGVSVQGVRTEARSALFRRAFASLLLLEGS